MLMGMISCWLLSFLTYWMVWDWENRTPHHRASSASPTVRRRSRLLRGRWRSETELGQMNVFWVERKGRVAGGKDTCRRPNSFPPASRPFREAQNTFVSPRSFHCWTFPAAAETCFEPSVRQTRVGGGEFDCHSIARAKFSAVCSPAGGLVSTNSGLGASVTGTLDSSVTTVAGVSFVSVCLSGLSVTNMYLYCLTLKFCSGNIMDNSMVVGARAGVITLWEAPCWELWIPNFAWVLQQYYQVLWCR